MKDKNIIILSMSCRKPFFQNQINCIKQTYASNLPSNIKFLYYTGLWKNTKLEGDHLMVHACDSQEDTFEKTYMALKYLYENDDSWDYIFRTNTSTYVNARLLNEICKIVDPNVLYTSELYALSEGGCPEPCMIYGRGNGLLLSRNLVRILLEEGVMLTYQRIVDDVCIGNIFNTYHMRRGENYLDYIKSLTHAWYLSVINGYDNKHKLCQFSANNIDYENFVTIQFKNYYNRDVETDTLLALHNVMNERNKNPIDMDKIIEYMKCPSVFIGSIIGYIDYDDYLQCSLDDLYNYQRINKAYDDVWYHKEVPEFDEN